MNLNRSLVQLRVLLRMRKSQIGVRAAANRSN